MKFLTSAVLLFLLGPAAAQLPADQVRAATSKAHLVGHEDEALLARIEDALATWDPRNLTSPYVKEIQTDRGKKHALRRPDLAEFIADLDAALALGKALFWEMRAGSDYGARGVTQAGTEIVFGTACASCHYRFGADARNRNTSAMALQAWETFVQERNLSADQPDDVPFAQRSRKYDPATDGNVSRNAWEFQKTANSHRLVGSQGVILRKFGGLRADGSEISGLLPATPAVKGYRDMFAVGGVVSPDGANRTRQITRRNSPTVINSVFADRQFHDGRAESTFNGYSIFGDYDKRVILKKASFTRNADGSFQVSSFHPATVAIPLASLASQAVGPVVNEVEMSHYGRTFHDLAVKLLDARPLADQKVAAGDSLLAGYLGGDATYRRLIQQAFRAEWWADDGETPAEGGFTPLNRYAPIDRRDLPTPVPAGSKDRLLINNFSLFWGLSVMLYESVLVSNQSPFDDMLRGKGDSVEATWRRYVTAELARLDEGTRVVPEEPRLPGTNGGGTEHPDEVIRKAQLDKLITLNAPPVLTGTAMFQRGLRVFVRNCAECHVPPYFSNAGEVELGPDIPKPIAKLHGHALVRTSLADAFKERLISEGFHPGGVTDANRGVLGNRLYFFDQERLPVITGLGTPLMIENMPLDAVMPLSFNQTTPPPREPRVPMITWAGTRPPLGFAPSPQPGAKPVDPYAFYDLGYYNIGVSEPRYDWGIWAFDGAEELISVEELTRTAAPGADLRGARGRRQLDTAAKRALASKIRRDILPEIADRTLAAEAINDLAGQLEEAENALQSVRSSLELGSAYRLPREGEDAAQRSEAMQEMLRKTTDKWKRVQQLRAQGAEVPRALADERVVVPVDRSGERNYLGANTKRKDLHFYKRARRMVMSEETWGHRKHFITDNELMGWGAFKTPSLRNTALTEPYMHNGRFLTLRQVLRFYSFDNTGLIPADEVRNPDLHPEMGRLDLNHDGQTENAAGIPGGVPNLTRIHDAESLLFFMHCLTDPRVERETAPFDHPGIVVPNGFRVENGRPRDEVIEISASSPGGGEVPAQFPAAR